jgi:hypothetical protein
VTVRGVLQIYRYKSEKQETEGFGARLSVVPYKKKKKKKKKKREEEEEEEGEEKEVMMVFKCCPCA